jgi:hypothetical protein
MERPEATAIVVEMARKMPEETAEGQALRIVLGELRLARVFMHEAEQPVARMEGMIDAALEL